MDSSLVQVDAVGNLAAAATVSRFRGQLRVTIVAKVTLAFSPNGEMSVSPPVGIVQDDVHNARNPMRSVHVGGDLAPYLERAEVVFWGQAHAPAGSPVDRMTVRLALANDQGTLVDKRLSVIGDRETPASAPKPFAKMPIVYERSLGGLGSHNPVGVGLGADGEQLPNVVYDEARSGETAGLGPIARTWPLRKRLLGSHPRRLLEQPVIELPDDFAWSYFQAAPADQQFAGFQGREWLVLEGLHPTHSMLHMRLPSLRVLARVHGARGAHDPFDLRPDALFIDGEAEHCTLGFRGSFAVPSEAALQALFVETGLELPGAPVVWPATSPAVRAPKRAAPSPAVQPQGTVAIDGTTPKKAPEPFQGTMLLDESFVGHGVPLAPPPAPPAPSNARAFQGTLAVDPNAPGGAALPFQAAGAPQAGRASPASKDATPWGEGAKPAPSVSRAFAGTMAIEPEAPQAAPAPLPEPPPPPPRPKTRDEVWKPIEPPPEAAPAPPEVPKRVPVAANPAVKKNVYGKFGKG